MASWWKRLRARKLSLALLYVFLVAFIALLKQAVELFLVESLHFPQS